MRFRLGYCEIQFGGMVDSCNRSCVCSASGCVEETTRLVKGVRLDASGVSEPALKN